MLSTLLMLPLLIGSGEPGWVARGSGAFPNDGKAFYAVGSASGIKNPALLRGSADNRARAELTKVFETYSASLMKDYMNSGGTQNVEQAVKTLSAGSLTGAEIVDRYRNSEGVQYALVKLDLEKAKSIAKDGKIFKPADLDKAYDEMSGMLKKSAPPPPPPEVAKPPPPTAGVAKPAPGVAAVQPTKEASSGAKQRTGRPGWVDGEDPAFPWNKYLYAVGFGRDRVAGENGAVAGLAKIFETKVAQVAKDFQAAYSKSGVANIEIQSSEVLTQTSTSKSLSGVRIAEVWVDKTTSTTYAIAVIERSVATGTLRSKISELDDKAKNALEKANDPDKLKQIRSLNQAISHIQEREMLNTDLRIIDAGGVGVAGELNYADVYSKLEGATEALNVGISVTGPQGDDVRAALTAGLTSLGYAVKEVGGSDDDDEDAPAPGGDFDLLILGKIRIEKAGQVQGTFEMVRAVADFQLKNVKKNKIIDETTVSQKEGHKTVQEAQRRAIRELNKVVAPQIAAKFQKYLQKK
jgi:hypothetical protein